MASSKKPRKRHRPLNPAAQMAGINLKKMEHVIKSLGKLSTVSKHNSEMLMPLVALFEVLKDKGIVTDQDIQNKLQDLIKKRDELPGKKDDVHTPEEIEKEAEAKRQLEEERQKIIEQEEAKRNSGEEATEGSSVQSEGTGDAEDNGGSDGQPVLPKSSD